MLRLRWLGVTVSIITYEVVRVAAVFGFFLVVQLAFQRMICSQRNMGLETKPFKEGCLSSAIASD
jgi:hypothetical protein